MGNQDDIEIEYREGGYVCVCSIAFRIDSIRNDLNAIQNILYLVRSDSWKAYC